MDKTTNKETFIRGGRLRKTSKGLISFAPFLAGASALALGALLTTTSPVEAGSCATAGQPAGTARCGDGADDSDSTEELEAPENSSFTVTDADNFGLNVQSANMKGIVITTKATTTDLTVDLDGNVGATDNALEIDMDGTGATTVTMDGALTSSGGDALYVNVGAAATGGVMITANGAVMAQTEGISIRKDNDSGTMSVMTGEDGDITSTAAEGIDITYLGGGVTLDIDGSITSYDDGILLSHSGGSGNAGGAISVTTGENSVITSIGDGQAGSINKNMKEDSRSGGHAINLGETGETSTDVTVVVNGDLGMNTDTGRIYYHGIRLIHEGTGDVNVTINGDVFGGYNTRVLNMTTRSTTDAMTLTLNGNVNTLDGRAVRGFGGTHSGRGLLDITIGSGATVTGFGNVLGSGTDGGTRITVDGTINLSASADGNTVRAAVYSRPTSNRVETEIDINNTVSGQQGVRMTNAGSATMNLDISSTVTGTNGNAVLLGNGGGATGGHVVTLEQGGALNGGIRSVNTGGGALTSGVVQLDINGMITVTSGDAIELGGTSAHTITLREQASVMGTIDVSAAAGGTTLDISGAVNVTSGNALEFGGAGSHTVILREGANIQGRIEKISGATGNVEFRIEGDISENPLVWKDTFDEATRPGRNTFLGFGPSDSIIIADGARVQPGTPMRELPGEDIHFGLNNTPVNLAGRLVFSGLFDEQQAFFARFNGIGGAVEIDLDFSRGDRERTGARFSANNLTGSTENIPVHIRAVGGLRGLLNEDGEVDAAYDTDGDGAITITNVITSFTLGTRGKDHFVAGDWLDNEVDDGDWELALVFDDSGFQPVWSVVARPRQQNRPGTGGGPGGPVVLAGPATLFDTLPMVLAHLGQPESMHRRTQNRSFQPSTGVWGKVQTRRLSVEPSAASFESDIHNVTFGVQAPIHTVMLGADVTLQTAETEAVIADGKQDIETNALIAGLAATWERDDLYVDGQFQYARFDNDLNAADGTKLASPTTDSFSAGVEVGYVIDAGNLKLGKWLGRGVLSNILVTPSAQVSWSQIGFSDFVAADGKTVSLDDGTVINGRVGIVAETLWESVVLHEAFAPASVRLQGSADVIVPLDGEVVTQVDGANQLSELEDPVLDVGIGVFYTWELGGHAYTLSGDISSRQGSEVEGYEGSLGFKYRF